VPADAGGPRRLASHRRTLYEQRGRVVSRLDLSDTGSLAGECLVAASANQARGAGSDRRSARAQSSVRVRWRERRSAEVVGYLAGDWIEVFAVDAGVYDHNSVVVLERLADLVQFAGVVDPVASRAERSGQLREVW